MKTAKVLKIGNVNKWTKWEHWPIFYITLELDNNETITLGKKKEDAFKVWDTVSYETVEEWKRRKEVKENPFTAANKQVFNQQQNIGAMVWMAYKLAFETYYDKKTNNFHETIEFANSVFNQAMFTFENYWKAESDSKIEDSTENDDLPF